MAGQYFDSCILIYAVENEPARGSAAREVLSQAVAEQAAYVSGLVRLECRIKPLRLDADELLLKFDEMFDRLNLLDFSVEAFDVAADLRVRYGLRTPDALHLGAAIAGECDEFWTNDTRLQVVEDRIQVRLLP